MFFEMVSTLLEVILSDDKCLLIELKILGNGWCDSNFTNSHIHDFVTDVVWY